MLGTLELLDGPRVKRPVLRSQTSVIGCSLLSTVAFAVLRQDPRQDRRHALDFSNAAADALVAIHRGRTLLRSRTQTLHSYRFHRTLDFYRALFAFAALETTLTTFPWI